MGLGRLISTIAAIALCSLMLAACGDDKSSTAKSNGDRAAAQSGDGATSATDDNSTRKKREGSSDVGERVKRSLERAARDDASDRKRQSKGKGKRETSNKRSRRGLDKPSGYRIPEPDYSDLDPKPVVAAVATLAKAIRESDYTTLCRDVYTDAHRLEYGGLADCISKVRQTKPPFDPPSYRIAVKKVTFKNPRYAIADVKQTYGVRGLNQTKDQPMSFKFQDGKWRFFLEAKEEAPAS